MSYFGFLALFLLIPIGILSLMLRYGKRPQPSQFNTFSAWKVIAIHVIIAVIWTTPWDNYLVATRVWWYDPDLVTGLTIGYVPIEEYTFFVLQPIMTGLWLVWLMRYWRGAVSEKAGFNAVSLKQASKAHLPQLIILSVVWLIMLVVLLTTERGNYLGLELTWAIPPIMLQMAFGADILWKNRRLVLMSILIPTIYLSIADAIAIQSGTWTISPTQSLDFHIFGVLPIEELLFFILTNTLIVFGCTLAFAQESRARVETMINKP